MKIIKMINDKQRLKSCCFVRLTHTRSAMCWSYLDVQRAGIHNIRPTGQMWAAKDFLTWGQSYKTFRRLFRRLARSS